MKKLFILIMLILCFVVISAQAIDWSAPAQVATRPVKGSREGNITVKNGKVAIIDAEREASSTWPTHYYNELTYTPGGTGSLTHVIQDELLPGSLSGTWGAMIGGIGLDDGQPVVGYVPWVNDYSSTGSVTTRHFGGVYSTVTATPLDSVYYSSVPVRESFRMDSLDKCYFVYTDITGASGYDIVVATAPTSTTATGSWTQTILATPDFPFPAPWVDSTYQNSAKIALAEGATTTIHTAYGAGHDPLDPFYQGPGYFSADGTTIYDTDMVADAGTRSKCDIAIDADGNPMVAALSGGGITVAFFDDATSTYTTSMVVAVADYMRIGQNNLPDYIDIELDGQGRPVVLVSSTDYVDDWTPFTEVRLDYYVYESGVWTGENVLTVTGVGVPELRYPDLTFDEDGRPFIIFSSEALAADRNLYLITVIDAGEPVIITPTPQEIGVNWNDEWMPVESLSADLRQLALAVDNGKLGLTYHGNTNHMYYTEFTYSGASMSLQVQDEDVTGAFGAYGVQIRGLDFDSSGNAVIGAIGPIGNPTLDAYVLGRLGGGFWSSEKASDPATLPTESTTYGTGEGGSWENFVLDPSGKEHFMWAAPDNDKIFYANKTSGSWDVNSMSTTGLIHEIRTDMALDDSNNPHVAYSDKNVLSSVFYTPDMVSGSYVGDCEIGSPRVRQDIEMSSSGYPMILHFAGTNGGIVLEVYDGSTWGASTLVSPSGWDSLDYSNGVGYYADLEVDPNDGRPVVVLASVDASAGTDSNVIVEYCKLFNTGWVKETIGDFNSGGIELRGLDLVFDETGRPFIGVVVQQTADGPADVLVLSAGFSTDPLNCGDYGTVFLDYDFNRNCYIDFGDLNILAKDWMGCTTPDGVGCSSAPGADNPPPFDIYPGSAVIDGDLSDWDEVMWIAMDKEYSGNPGADLKNAEWAAKWDDASNRIYMAIRGTDTFHDFDDGYGNWNAQDCIEIYVDADNGGEWLLSDNYYMLAQQWTIGPDAGATRDVWGGGVWVNIYGTLPVTGYQAAVGVTGDVISYELALPPFENFYYDNPANNTEVDLQAGITIGLDVFMITRYTSSGPPYDSGVWCENTIHGLPSGKWDDALAFRDYTLKAAGTGSCGDWGYLEADLNTDCLINLADFAVFAEKWMRCTDPAVAGCDQYWKF